MEVAGHEAQDLIEEGGSHLIVSYPSYSGAQRAVDHLAGEGFPVESISIVGRGLKFVEDVTGKRNFVRSAARGLGSGALVGGFVGFFVGLTSLVDPLASAIVVAFWGLIFGAGVGLILGVLAEAIGKGKGDFTSIARLTASGFEVVADDREAAASARAILKRDRLLPLMLA